MSNFLEYPILCDHTISKLSLLRVAWYSVANYTSGGVCLILPDKYVICRISFAGEVDIATIPEFVIHALCIVFYMLYDMIECLTIL